MRRGFGSRHANKSPKQLRKRQGRLSRRRPEGYGGDEGDRTLDLGIANAALSQLSYVPGEAKL